MEPVVIKLAVPVKDGNDDVTELVFTRRPTAGDLEILEEHENKQRGMQAILAKLLGLSPKTVRQLDAYDYRRASEQMANFLENSPATGETPSGT